MLRNTEIFGLQHRIDVAIRGYITFQRFRDEIRERFETQYPESEVLAEPVLQFLYERAVEARADLLWSRRLQQIDQSSDWKAHREWLDDAIKRTRDLMTILKKGDRRPMADDDARKVGSVAQSTQGLLARFIEIRNWDRRLSEIARIRINNACLRQLRSASARILGTKCPMLNKNQVAELIALVIETTGIKNEAPPESIARQLRRARKHGSSPIRC